MVFPVCLQKLIVLPPFLYPLGNSRDMSSSVCPKLPRPLFYLLILYLCYGLHGGEGFLHWVLINSLWLRKFVSMRSIELFL